jgi:hypothetical protein
VSSNQLAGSAVAFGMHPVEQHQCHLSVYDILFSNKSGANLYFLFMPVFNPRAGGRAKIKREATRKELMYAQ